MHPFPKSSRESLKVVVIGCGAVAQQFHLPVLAGHRQVELTACVDRNLANACKLAEEYQIPHVFAESSEITPDIADAAVICTPPFHHAPCAVELAGKGIHVFVEKPMTLTHADALRMVEAAEAAGVVLSVGTFRRLLPSTRMLKALVDSEWLGRPLRFDLRGGSEYGWAAATLGNMRKDLAGGGVLMDIGPHVLDQILYILGNRAELIEYQDNSLGGIETDCLARLRIARTGGDLEGCVELSRLRPLRNTLQIECERGRLEIATNERYEVVVTPQALDLHDSLRREARPYRLKCSWADEPDMPWFEPFRMEIDDWVEAIQAGKTPELSGRSALPVVKLIDDCYQQASRLCEPWVEEGLAKSALPNTPQGPRKRVLVTGATGFVGCRVAELLQLAEGWDVRALVHSPARAARLARLPVEMVMGDLSSPEDCRRIVEGCDAVVHCGIGTSYGNRAEIFAVTVGGTKNLAEAALAAGVKRFVQISTMSVYGSDVHGTLDESSPVRPTSGDDYSESKAAAEEAITDAVSRGLPAVTLRLTTVYGPYAPLIKVGPIKRLLAGQLVVPRGAAAAPSNTVYIDNVVAAITAALNAPEDRVKGEAFNIGEGDEWTCGEFYEHLTSAMDMPYPLVDDDPRDAATARKPGWLSSWGRGVREILGSAEMRQLLGKGLATDPVGRLPRAVLEKSPRVKQWLRRRMKLDEPQRYLRPQTATPPPLRVRPLPAQVSTAKAERLLGYSPVVSRERGLELTVAWMRHSRLLP